MRSSGVEFVILGALRAGPRSGYEIKQLVDKATRFFWAASYGQIYPELRRLEDAGLVEGEPDPHGARQRTSYRLTDAGREHLLAWLCSPDAGAELRDEGLLKLFFADGEELDVLRAMQTDRAERLEELRAIESRLGFTPLVLRFGIDLHEWMVEWCSRAEREVSKLEEVAR